MSTTFRRLILTAAATGAVILVFTVRATAQPFLAAAGHEAASCVPPNQPPCSRGLLHVVNGATLTVQNSVPLWEGQAGITVHKVLAHPGGALVFVAQTVGSPTPTAAWVDIVDVRNMVKRGTFSIEGTLREISPDGTRLYVTRSTGVQVLDSATGAVLSTIPITAPGAVAASPNGARIYVAGGAAQPFSITVVDTGTQSPIGSIPMATNFVQQLEFTADGQHLFALVPNSLVFDIDPATNAITRTITNFGGPSAPHKISAAAGRLYVAVSFQSPGVAFGEGIAAIDVGTGGFIDKANLVDPYDVEASTDGTRVWALGFGSPRLTTIDGATNQVISSLPAGSFLGLAAIPPQRPAQVVLEQPAAGATVQQPFNISGYAVDPSGLSGPGVSTVHVWAFPADNSAPTFVGADYGRPRADVGALFGSSFTNSGFQIAARGLRPGAYRLVAFAFTVRTGQFSIVHDVSITIAGGGRIAVDTPQDGSTVAPRFVIAGWALDGAAATGTGIDAVHVWAYPAAGGSPVFAGAATLGDARPDVGAYFGAQFANAGYHLEVSNLAPGTYTLIVYGHSTVTGTFSVEQHVRVTIPARQPVMWIDTPAPNATIGGTFALAGWAVELNATDTGVDLIHIWATTASGAATFLGSATYGISRPDIGAWLGAQYAPSGFALTASLPPGAYTISVYARSTETGTFRQWSTVQITVQ